MAAAKSRIHRLTRPLPSQAAHATVWRLYRFDQRGIRNISCRPSPSTSLLAMAPYSPSRQPRLTSAFFVPSLPLNSLIMSWSWYTISGLPSPSMSSPSSG